MRKFCVIGNPVSHSLSPTIHKLFAQQAGIELEYHKVLSHDFVTTVNEFKHNGGLGANVTVPFKEQAYQYADSNSTAALTARAVNTLYFKNNTTFGDNTDGAGLIKDLTEILNLKLNNKTVLVLGAGGATRGILAPLLQQKVKITLANRTLSKAQGLAQEFHQYGNILPSSLNDISGVFYLIINATASSLSGQALDINPKVLHANTVCYDLMYSQKDTLFMHWARQNGAKLVVDGLGMLVAQAALSFSLWNDFMPNIKAVIKKLR